MLEIFFARGAGTGLELNDEMVLRYDPETNAPLSLIFIIFSKLIQRTEYGIESFQLTGIGELTPLKTADQKAKQTCHESAPESAIYTASAKSSLSSIH